MKIQLKKFGSILTSRESGREAYNAFLPTINAAKGDELLEIDFSEIGALTPSWADEFLSKLQDTFGDRLILLPTSNLSAQATIELLESIRGKKFRR